MNLSSIQFQHPQISAVSYEEDKDYIQQLTYAANDQFSLADLKNFAQAQLFYMEQVEEKIYILSLKKDGQQLFNLFILYFFANSQGKQHYLSKFKQLVYKNPIYVPEADKKEIFQLNNEFKSFFPIVVSKLKHYLDNFKAVDSSVNFLENYELVLNIAKVIFFNFLNKHNAQSIVHSNMDIGVNEINMLIEQFSFDQKDIILKFNVQDKKLQLKNSYFEQQNLQTIQIGSKITNQSNEKNLNYNEYSNSQAANVEPKILSSPVEAKNVNPNQTQSQIINYYQHHSQILVPQQITQQNCQKDIKSQILKQRSSSQKTKKKNPIDKLQPNMDHEKRNSQQGKKSSHKKLSLFQKIKNLLRICGQQ